MCTHCDHLFNQAVKHLECVLELNQYYEGSPMSPGQRVVSLAGILLEAVGEEYNDEMVDICFMLAVAIIRLDVTRRMGVTL